MQPMTRLKPLAFVLGLAAAAATTAAAGFAQHPTPSDVIGGPLAGPMPFVDAPFSADAITTAKQVLRSGSLLDQSTTARYYRDRAGRVRVELLMEGLRAPQTMSERHMRLTVYPMTVVHPPAPWTAGYTLDPVTRTTWHTGRSLRPLSSGGGHSLEIPIGGVRYLNFARAGDFLGPNPHLGFEGAQRVSLGTRRIAGVDTTGHRTTFTVPAMLFRNEDPIDLVDEQWDSAELGLVIYGRYSDSLGGVIEYRLTNIRLADPPPDLFVVPPDYELRVPSGSTEDPLYAAQDGRWVAKSLAWSVER